MKTKLSFLILFLTLSVYSQYQNGQIEFIDGKTIKGLVKISGNKLKFKEIKTDKAVTYDYNKVKYAILTNDKNEQIIFEYVYFDFQKKPLLLKVLVDDFLRLYSNDVSYYTGAYGFRDTSTFYLKKRNDELGQWFLCYGYFPKTTFKNVIEKYFNDCKSIQDKVGSNEFKKNDYLLIVEYYNLNCAPKK